MRLRALASRITHVSVFRKGARVRRVAKVESAWGPGEALQIGPLPLCVDKSSVRARVIGEQGVWVARTQVQSSAVHSEVQQEEADPELVPWFAQRESWKSTIASLEALSLDAHPDVHTLSSVEARLDLLAFRREQLQHAYRELDLCEREIEERQRTPEIKAEPHVEALVVLDGEALEHGFELSIEYDVPGAVWAPAYRLYVDERLEDAKVAMHAIVLQQTGEDWRGVKLRLATSSMHAQVTQGLMLRTVRSESGSEARWRASSGGVDALFEDFDRVCAKERSSTVAPGSECESDAIERDPELESVDSELEEGIEWHADEESERISIPPLALTPAVREESLIRLGHPEDRWMDYYGLELPAPSERSRGRLRPRFSNQHVVDQDQSFALLEQRAHAHAQSAARVPLPSGYSRPRSQNGFDFVFESDEELSIPNDTSFSTVLMGACRCEFNAAFVLVPRQVSDVFRRLTLYNTQQKPFLEGPVDVYLGGTYLMTAAMPHVRPSKSLELYVGTEPDIRVERKVRVVEENNGLIRGQKELRHKIRIEVSNALDRPALVEVRERVPVAHEEASDIRVSIEEVSPPWRRFAPNRPELPGRYRWREQIDSDSSMLFSVDYTVRTSARSAIEGAEERGVG